jgi:quercetin dioxygenase-like cupin family protein
MEGGNPIMEDPMRQKFLVVIIALGLGCFGFAKMRQERAKTNGSAPEHIMVTPDTIKWQPLPREWADGPPPRIKGQAENAIGQTEVAIIQGDPTKEGAPFVIRLRSAPGSLIPPHWHPIDENITVLSGVFCLGMGDKLDANACQDMPAGSYMVMPKGAHHFAVAKGNVVQVHGIGPFKIYWVK